MPSMKIAAPTGARKSCKVRKVEYQGIGIQQLRAPSILANNAALLAAMTKSPV